MKNLKLILITISTLFIYSCNKEVEEVYVAGHLIENEEENFVKLLGPKDVTFKIQKDDIIKIEGWDEKFENLKGEPKKLTLKKTAKIKEGNNILQFENQDKKMAACACEVTCGRGVCCAISGWKTKCSRSSCVTTTDRCTE